MPYSSKSKLPPAVKKLGSHQQSIWMSAFNAAFKQYEGNEEKAFAVAWAAVRKRKKDSAMAKRDAFPFKKKEAESEEEDGDVCDPESDAYDEEACEAKKAKAKKTETGDARSWIETVAFDKGNMRYTADGYLVAQARVARTGIQLYQGHELGDEREVVRVYRPEKTVFDSRSLHTFAHKPVTLNHPPEMVNAHNWKDYAVGHVDGEIVRDGDMVRVPMMITDASAVEAVRAGTTQLSVGYDARLEMVDGVTDDGEEYDAIQHDIRVNHIALTPNARGGPKLRLGDNRKKEPPKMDREVLNRKLTFDGISIEIPETSAEIVNKVVERLTTENQTLSGKVAALAQQVKDATITDADLDARVTQRQQLVALAQKVLGDKWTPDGKSSADIRREAVTHKLGDKETKDMSDAAIEGAFKVVTTDSMIDNAGTRELAQALARPGFVSPGSKQSADEAWEARGKELREAWKNNNGSVRN